MRTLSNTARGAAEPTGGVIRQADYFAIRRAIGAGEIPLFDLRSPGEFAKGAIPHAINVPLLDDDERHRIGIIYKVEGQLPAVQLGLELFAEKSERFLDTVLAHVAGRPAVALHCWRGGMRSQSVAMWLATLGLEIHILTGGYKQYRRTVLERLDQFAEHDLLVLNGRTGVGKSEFLRSFPPGFPAVDFEAIARHRGSAFGDFNQSEPQVTQQTFENLMAEAYLDVAHHPTIVVEAENFIGGVALPERLRNRVFAQPMLALSRDFDDRVAHIVAEYAEGWTPAMTELFAARLEKHFRKALPPAKRSALVTMVSSGDIAGAVAALLNDRYDRLYDRNLERHKAQIEAHFDLTRQWDEAIAYVTRRVARSGGST